MLPTRRLLFLAGLGLIPAVLAAWVPGLFLLALLYLAGCCALAVGSYLLGVGPDEVRFERRLSSRLSPGEAEQVEIRVQNDTRRTLRVEVTDSTPTGWETEGLPGVTTVRPGAESVVAYRVTPGSRGRFRFGDLHARLEQAPGLAQRTVRVPAPQEVRVYPDLREITKYELMARRSRLEELGIHRTRLAGRGTEFERIREYTPDDEYRHVDWKATARRRRPMSRVYEVERSQNVFMVLDAGRMMAGRVGRLTKLDYAINAALMLAHVALKVGDRVGLLIVSDGVDAYLPLGKGQAQFRQCTELLYGVEARLCHVDYRGALEQIAVRCKRRSLVVFFTDLVDEDPAAELVTYLRLLRPTHLPLCVTLQDAHMVAAATGACETVEGMYERAVAVDLLSERRRVLENLHRLGAVVLDSPPAELSVAVVNRYLELKCRQLL